MVLRCVAAAFQTNVGVWECPPIPPPLRVRSNIVGGESGHGARLWTLRGRGHCAISCKRWRVAFFCKQMGSVYGEHKGKDLPPDLNIREFPEVKA